MTTKQRSLWFNLCLLIVCGFGAGVLAACTHTDSYLTGDLPLLGPKDPGITPEQLTFNTLNDTAHTWTADGKAILYVYEEPDLKNHHTHCLGLMSPLGGTRLWSMCDVTSYHVDSVDRISATALTPSGQLMYVQGVHRPPFAHDSLTAVLSTWLWLSDTANPLATRRKLATLPVIIGDSVISWFSDVQFSSDVNFSMLGWRYNYAGGGRVTVEPRMIVRGTLTSQGATLEQVRGTARVTGWSRAPSSDYLFVRGDWWTFLDPLGKVAFQALLMDSVIYQIPEQGGVSTNAFPMPRRPGSLSCHGNNCLVTDQEFACLGSPAATSCILVAPFTVQCLAGCSVRSTRLYHLDLSDGKLTTIYTSPNRAGDIYSPRFNSLGTEYVYLQNENLYHTAFTKP